MGQARHAFDEPVDLGRGRVAGAPRPDQAVLGASEAALRVCERASRVVASYGFAAESPIQRYLRDVRFTLIGGGTSELLRMNIARGL